MLPPATPPLRSSTSDPGLLTSNDRMTISLGLEVKSLTGIGIFLERYSQITSMLYFSWAEIGMMGAPSATVPTKGRDGEGGLRDGKINFYVFFASKSSVEYIV